MIASYGVSQGALRLRGTPARAAAIWRLALGHGSVVRPGESPGRPAILPERQRPGIRFYPCVCFSFAVLDAENDTSFLQWQRRHIGVESHTTYADSAALAATVDTGVVVSAPLWGSTRNSRCG
ncbi:hypothetical protein GCM10009078_34810 [Cupriavidus gilardii]